MKWPPSSNLEETCCSFLMTIEIVAICVELWASGAQPLVIQQF